MPAQRPLAVWRGNSLDLPLVLKTRAADGTETPVDLTGSVLVFRASNTAGVILRLDTTLSGFEITDAPAGKATLHLTVAQSRLFPMGEGARYEIERRVGSAQKTLLFGKVIASEWANDD